MLDARIHAVDERRRWAEAALEGQLPGSDSGSDSGREWRWIRPQRLVNGAARLSLKAAPDPDAAQVTEALPGEAIERLWDEQVRDEQAGDGDGWVRVRTVADGYLGWVPKARLDPGASAPAQALSVTALRAHAYAGPGVSQPVVAELCFGAVVGRGAGEVVEEHHRRWQPVLLPGGGEAWVQEVCFLPVQDDLLAFARRFVDTPYVWGGRSAWGLDCSGLTGLVYGAFGRPLPRDADQQQAALVAVPTPQAGDLAFFPGHVGLMLDERRMLHANATWMRVSIETLGEGEYGTRLADSCAGYGRWA